MNNSRINIIGLALITLFVSSCKKEESGPSTDTGNTEKLGSGVLVLNEGQFLANNASVTMRSSEGETSKSLFQSNNGNKVLGDVLNSAMETESNYYLVVNNSQKIEVVGKSDFVSTATIQGFSSPRRMIDLGNGKALVSNLKLDTMNSDNTIDVVDLNSNVLTSSIAVSGTCEDMLMNGNNVFVANTDRNQIIVLDRSNLTVTETIKTAPRPKFLLEDKFGFLWVMCEGDYINNVPPALMKINMSNKSVEKQFDFSQGTFVSNIAINSGGGTIYIISDKLYKMAASAGSLNLTPFLSTASMTSIYGLGVDPDNDYIYLGDAKDYISKGRVYVIDPQGNAIEDFEAGINPNGFLFR